jgi:hypothetical protein
VATVAGFKGQAIWFVDFSVSNTIDVLGTAVTQQMSSAYSLDVDSLHPGEKAYQVRVSRQPDDPNDSNAIYHTADCEVSVHRALHLTEMVEDENLYTSGEMLYGQDNLMSAASWRALDAVHEVLEAPEMEAEPERIGNIISYTVRLVVSIAL